MSRKAQKTQKQKIAIAIDNGLLAQIDALIDGHTLISRSQAIGHFLQKSLKDVSVAHAVILLHHSHHECALKAYGGKPFLAHQLEFFSQHGIREVVLVTQQSPLFAQIAELGSRILRNFTIIESSAKGTAQALEAVKERFRHVPFVAMSGDTLNLFDLTKMTVAHMQSGKLASMGLVNKEKLTDCGVVQLDGDTIIDIEHNSAHPKSHIINAGVYVFRPEIFGLLTAHMVSLEYDLFPQLVSIRQLRGHFTHGQYIHIPETSLSK